MARYDNGRVVGFYYNSRALRYPPQVTQLKGESSETVEGQLVTADGLYFMTADNKEFITKESVNG